MLERKTVEQIRDDAVANGFPMVVAFCDDWLAMHSEHEELVELRQWNSRLEVERDLLKAKLARIEKAARECVKGLDDIDEDGTPLLFDSAAADLVCRIADGEV